MYQGLIHDQGRYIQAARAKSPYEIVGIKRGWVGLIYMDPNGKGDDPEHTKLLNPSMYVQFIIWRNNTPYIQSQSFKYHV